MLPLAVTIPVIALVATLIYSNLGPVLVPSAPVRGRRLPGVAAQWVKPAEFGIEALMSIYVSMGVVSPQTVGRAPVISNDWASRVDKSVA